MLLMSFTVLKYTSQYLKKVQPTLAWTKNKLFFHLLPKPRTYFCVRLIDGTARIFLTSYASIGNQNHVSPVAPRLRDPCKDALPTELQCMQQ